MLLAVPMLLVAPGVFVNKSSTPKMLAVAVGLCLLLDNRLKRRVAAHVPLFVFFAVCCLSWFFAADKWVGFAGSPRAPYYGLFGVAVVILAYIGSSEMETEEIERALLAGAIVLATVAIFQQIAGRSLIGMGFQNGRSSGLRGSPVMMAASLTPCFLVAWHRFRSRWFEPCWAEAAAMVLFLAAITAARAKGAFLSMIVGVWVYETGGFARWSGLFAAWLGVNAFVQRGSEPERVELLKIAWKSFKQHPLLGWGPDNFIYALIANRTPAYDALVGKNGQSAAHQDIAQIAVTLGLAGVAAYLAVLWKLFRALWSDGLAPAVLAAMLIQAQVNPIPLDVLVIVAVILGSRQLDAEGCVRIPSWVAPAMMGAATVLALNDLTPLARSWP